jgi:hypothetical protein
MQNKLYASALLLCFGFVAIQGPGQESYRAVVSVISSNGPSPVKEIEPSRTNQPPDALSLKLKPTAIASADAAGSVEVNSRTISLHLSKVSPGRYHLAAVRRSVEIPERLGTIVIEDPTLAPDREANENKKEASNNSTSVLIQTDATINLPRGLSARDIDRILLLGPGGNAVLVGEVK